MSAQDERTSSRQVTDQCGSVSQMNNNDHVFATDASHIDGHRLWSNRDRERWVPLKTLKTRHLINTPRDHSRILRLWHTTSTDGEE